VRQQLQAAAGAEGMFSNIQYATHTHNSCILHNPFDLMQGFLEKAKGRFRQPERLKEVKHFDHIFGLKIHIVCNASHFWKL